MKKLVAFVMVGVLIALLFCAYAEGVSTSLLFDGKTVEFIADRGGLVVDEAGIVQMPAEKIAELTNGTVKIDKEKQRIEINCDGIWVAFVVGQKQIWTSDMGLPKTAESVPRIIDNIYYAPAESAFRELGFTTSWNDKTKTMSVTGPKVKEERSVWLGDVPNLSDCEIYENLPDASALFRKIEAEDISKLANDTFKASYFNICEPNKVLGTETLKEIRFSERQGDKFGLRPNLIGTVVAGNIVVDRETDKTIRFFHDEWLNSWGRVYVDGQLVVYTEDRNYGNVHLKKGRHKIVVELINNHATAEMNVTVEKCIPILDDGAIAKHVQGIVKPNTNLRYLRFPDDNSPRTLTINASPSKEPIFLFIFSTGNDSCVFKIPKGTIVQGIVTNQYIHIEGIDTKTPVVIYPQLLGCDSLYPSCEDQGIQYEMMDSGFKALDQQIQSIANRRLNKMLIWNLPEPNILLTADVYKKIENEYARIENLVKTGPVKLENLYENQAGIDVKNVKSMSKYILGNYSVPANRFRGIYVNTDDPKTVVKSDLVDDININYMEHGFWNIPSVKIGACWIGDWDFEKDVDKIIAVEGSYNNFVVWVDGVMVMQGEDVKTLPYRFKKGKHRIEVDFLSNYFSTGFHVLVSDKKVTKNQAEMKALAKQLQVEGSKFYFVAGSAAYGTSQKTSIRLKKETKPIVLILDAYPTVLWNIQNPDNDEIKAIFVRSYSDATMVTISGGKTVPVYYFDKQDSNDFGEAPGRMMTSLNNGQTEIRKTDEQYQAFNMLIEYLGVSGIDGCSVTCEGSEAQVPAIRIQ